MLKTAFALMVSMVLTTSLAHADSISDLKSMEGTYSVAAPSDFYCQRIAKVQIAVDVATAAVDLQLNDQDFQGSPIVSKIPVRGVNTGESTTVDYLTSTGEYQWIYDNSSLQQIVRYWSLKMYPGPWKVETTLLKVVDADTLVFNYKKFGTTTCTLKRD